jgi:hypothetical protein
VRLFTIDEANALLPTLRKLLHKLDRERARLSRLSHAARAAAAVAADGGGTPGGHEYALALVAFVEAMQEIGTLGIEIKDLERGLCDFPHIRDGRVVYLCWQKGEDAIEWWHDIEAGFAGRQPL